MSATTHVVNVLKLSIRDLNTNYNQSRFSTSVIIIDAPMEGQWTPIEE